MLHHAMKAIIYTRVSTDQQAKSGLGMEAQLARCRAHVQARGYELMAELSDPAISGKDAIFKRPGLQKLLDLAAKREDLVIVVYSLSRLSRRQSLTWTLLDASGDYRLQVQSVTEPFDTSTPMGRAMLGMMAVWAALEADMCGERTAAALAARRARGLVVGPKPFGTKHPETARWIKRMYEGADDMPRMSYVTISQILNEKGVAPPLRGKWHPNQVRRIILAPIPDPASEGAKPNDGHATAPSVSAQAAHNPSRVS